MIRESDPMVNIDSEEIPEPTKNENKILELCFIDKFMPAVIATISKVSKARIYKIVEDLKRLYIRVKQNLGNVKLLTKWNQLHYRGC